MHRLLLFLFVPFIIHAMHTPSSEIVLSKPEYDAVWDNFTVTALHNSTKAGSISYRINHKDSAHWYIDVLEVKKSWRKKGVGYQLFRECLKLVKASSGKVITWEVSPLDDTLNVSDLITVYTHMIKKVSKNITPLITFPATVDNPHANPFMTIQMENI